MSHNNSDCAASFAPRIYARLTPFYKGKDGQSVYEVWLSIPGNEGKSKEEFVKTLQGTWPDLDESVSNAAQINSSGKLSVNNVTKTECPTDFLSIYQLSK